MWSHISLFIRQRNIREPAEYRRRRREAQRETFETPPTQCDYCTLTFGRLIPSFFFQKFRKWRSTVYAITHSRLAESMHSQSVSNFATNESQPLEMTDRSKGTLKRRGLLHAVSYIVHVVPCHSVPLYLPVHSTVR
jgi:hypothetical protein